MTARSPPRHDAGCAKEIAYALMVQLVLAFVLRAPRHNSHYQLAYIGWLVRSRDWRITPA
jgi:hypothetical protein